MPCVASRRRTGFPRLDAPNALNALPDKPDVLRRLSFARCRDCSCQVLHRRLRIGLQDDGPGETCFLETAILERAQRVLLRAESL